MDYNDISYITDAMYKMKIDNIKNKLLDRQSKFNEYSGNIEKKNNENSKEIETKRTKVNIVFTRQI